MGFAIIITSTRLQWIDSDMMRWMVQKCAAKSRTNLCGLFANNHELAFRRNELQVSAIIMRQSTLVSIKNEITSALALAHLDKV